MSAQGGAITAKPILDDEPWKLIEPTIPVRIGWSRPPIGFKPPSPNGTSNTSAGWESFAGWWNGRSSGSTSAGGAVGITNVELTSMKHL